MSDCTEQLQNSVSDALKKGVAMNIKGSGSKDFYGADISDRPLLTPLLTTEHRGVINYEPKELVITARSGTPLAELEALLAEQGQMLAFEPPYFSKNATIGGTIACGFSGPRRPYAGSARDFVLGTHIINGRAEVLHFGGEVMKNVAGYDVSRLMVGAMGTLGLILDISLKVLPLPEQELSLMLECRVDEAIRLMNEWSGSPLPLSAACYDGANLTIRLCGAPAAVIAGSKRIGGDKVHDGQAFWKNVAELQHGFFTTKKNLWRLSLPSDTPHLDLPGKQFIDWGGAQRWFIADDEQLDLYQTIERAGGHAALFRRGKNSTKNCAVKSNDDEHHGDVFQPLSAALFALHANLKRSFDPNGIFNPGRLYREL